LPDETGKGRNRPPLSQKKKKQSFKRQDGQTKKGRRPEAKSWGRSSGGLGKNRVKGGREQLFSICGWTRRKETNKRTPEKWGKFVKCNSKNVGPKKGGERL